MQVQPRLCYVVLAANLAVYAAGVGIALTQVCPPEGAASLLLLPTGSPILLLITMPAVSYP